MNNKRKNIAISSCLVGAPCRWDGKKITDKKALEIYSQGNVMGVCPEILAGLSTPRPACEIINGDGFDVLKGTAQVVDKKGNDYTEIFIGGAKKAMQLVLDNNIKMVYLKSGSPSCAGGNINDGRFIGVRKKGYGIFAALLKQNGIEVEELG